MLTLRLAALALLSVPAAASAQSMNAEIFFKRALALKAKGPTAFMSRDFKPLTNEAKAAGLLVRATRLAAVKAGRQPLYCPPAGSKRMGPSEFLAALGNIPVAQRTRIDMGEATTRIMARKFPC